MLTSGTLPINLEHWILSIPLTLHVPSLSVVKIKEWVGNTSWYYTIRARKMARTINSSQLLNWKLSCVRVKTSLGKNVSNESVWDFLMSLWRLSLCCRWWTFRVSLCYIQESGTWICYHIHSTQHYAGPHAELFAVCFPAPAWPCRDVIYVSVSSSLCQKSLTYVSSYLFWLLVCYHLCLCCSTGLLRSLRNLHVLETYFTQTLFKLWEKNFAELQTVALSSIYNLG